MDTDSSSGGAGEGGVRARLARYMWLLGVLGCANGVTGIDTPDESPEDPAHVGVAGASAVDEPGSALWCLARGVLEAKCQRCHGDPTERGAPFSLVSFDDTQLTNNRGKPRFELIAEAVSSELMPPLYLKLDPPVAALDELERANLLAWCEAGAPAPDVSCD